jgi:hypothetical protein
MRTRVHYAAAVACVACHSSAILEQPATVNFVLVAPGCSSVLPVEFSLDNRLVGVDTFRVAVAAPRTVSRAFEVSPGQHVLGAQVVGGYVWASRVVVIAPGTAVSDSLPFYCS